MREGITRSGESLRLRRRSIQATVSCVTAIATRPSRPVWLNFEAIDARCAELGATTESERARLLGTTPPSLSRYRRGLMDITLARAARLAANIGFGLADVVAADPKPPSNPPGQPKPPSGPGSPKPPSGPKEKQR